MPWNDAHPNVSIVIPVYRAEAYISESLVTLEEFVVSTNLNVQLILVDDGSPDSTPAKLMAFASVRDAVTFIRHETNMGKGRAVADGISAAAAPIIVFTDADIPYELSVVEDIVARFRSDGTVQMLAGSRQHPDSIRQKPYGIIRRLASWAFTSVAGKLIAGEVTDVQCGIKAFRRDAARLLFSNLIIARFAFDVELFLRVNKYNLHFDEIPVTFRHAQKSSFKIIPASMRMVKDLWHLYVAYRTKA